MNEFYAHKYQGHRELLIDHLHDTAELAEKFAAEFNSGAVGKQLGLLHDVGKHTRFFQEVLDRKRIGINHAIVGAEVYFDKCVTGIIPNKKLALFICMCINCHHSSLHSKSEYCVPTDFHSVAQILTDDREKINALSDRDEWEEILSYVENEKLLITIQKGEYLNIMSMTSACKMFYARMLFSCLVDADYTATATFENDLYFIESEGAFLDPDKRLRELKEYRKKHFAGSNKSSMNVLREQVYKDADENRGKPGVYTMTAPTGTGKTIALITFALRQAAQNHQGKIFIVLPYLSIITQNADVYRSIFGDAVVLEDDSQTVYTEKTRLLSDRWSAPVIVTTSVRFFETLFRIKTTDIRRLHQVANAVIIFDESQTLPPGITDITMEIMKELTENYGSTVLLSTATQPAYQFRKHLAKIPFNTTEVIQNPDELFRKYDIAKRTETIFSTDRVWSYEALLEYFTGENQVLLIFNTVAKSHAMYQMLKREGEKSLAYLSSSLCPAHRREMLDLVKKNLEGGKQIWLISTQCIEAGVDIDFPCGAREFAPYTSIVQSAGRINRNGRTEGKLLVFRMEDQGNSGYPGIAYKNETMIAYSMAKHEDICLNDRENVEKYYQLLFTGSSGGEEDIQEIQEAVNNEDYKALSEAYQLIDQKEQDIVIVPYEKEIYEEIKCQLKERNWSLSKEMMKKAHDIAVSVKLREEIKHYCKQLLIITRQGAELTNWYLLERPDFYSKELGFIQTMDLGDAIFV